MEYKEDLQSGRKTAAAGGFTGVALLPNTHPTIESKNEIHYLTTGNVSAVTQVYPYGAVTKSCKGEELTEMLDMHAAGAVAFTDGEKPVWHTDIFLKTLLYLRKFDGLLINKPEDKYLNAFGTMNEGKVNTVLGMKGMPKIAEEVMIKRDLQILEYAGGRLHFSNISSAESVRMIRNAKKSGLRVTCDVAAYNLIWEDKMVGDYDTCFKLNPPLREQNDIRALEKGLLDGTIDAITTSHSPQDKESKRLEFDHAEFGITGLQTFFSLLLSKYSWKEVLRLMEKFTVNPRKILGLEVPAIAEGQKANLTLFDPEGEWIFTDEVNLSKSDNNPLRNTKLKGTIIGVLNNGRIFFN
jgi:dihydroorotase